MSSVFDPDLRPSTAQSTAEIAEALREISRLFAESVEELKSIHLALLQAAPDSAADPAGGEGQ